MSGNPAFTLKKLSVSPAVFVSLFCLNVPGAYGPYFLDKDPSNNLGKAKFADS